MMVKFEKFLFFYSILAITTLFVIFGIFAPKPINFTSLALLTPIIFYFYIRLTSPEKVSAEKWSIRFILSIFVISALFVFAYRLPISINSSPKTPSPSPSPTQLILVSPSPRAGSSGAAGGESVADIILGTPKPLPQITGRPGAKTITVYEKPSLNSPKISTLNAAETYLYLEKQSGWYKVVLSDSSLGWISSSEVVEAP